MERGKRGQEWEGKGEGRSKGRGAERRRGRSEKKMGVFQKMMGQVGSQLPAVQM